MKRKLLRILSTVLAVMLTVTVGAPLASAVPSDVKIVSLRTDYAEDPIGIDSENPVFSWEMSSDARGILQTHYQLTVREGAEDGSVVWDSGKVEDGRSNNIEYAGTALKSQTVYYWSVTVWDNKGGKTVSDTASFETGLYEQEDWSGAKWLKYSAVGGSDDDVSDTVNYVYETDFQITHDNMGLIFSAQDSSSFYMWAVNTNNGSHPNLRRHIFSGGNVSYVEDITLPEQFTKDSLMGSEHHIAVAVKGNTVTTSIDGVVVDEYTDNSGALILGRFGVRFHNEGARFDNMKAVAYGDDGSEQVLIDADFEDNVNPFTQGTIVTVNGSKKLLVESTGDEIRVFEKTESEPKDIHYTYDLDFQIVRDNLGVSFSAQNTGNFYMWAINTNNSSHPYLRRHVFTNNSAGNVQDITLPSQFTAASLKDREHHLTIEVEGYKVTTTLDGVVVDTYTDTAGSLCEGYFGFRFHNEAARVDNVKAVSYRDSGEYVLIDSDFENGVNPFNGGNVVDVNGNKKLYMESSGETKILENRISAASMFRKDFTVGKKIESARLYASALGVSDYYINGQRVGTKSENGMVYDELKPGWTDYDDTVFYLTYDVTDMIKQGDNAIGAEVASGWYNGVIAVRGGSTYSGLDNGLMMKLDITYSDGTSDTIVTDGSWTALKDGCVSYADIYNGEVYNANKDSISVWSKSGYNDAEWYPAAIKNDYRGRVMAAIGSKVQSRTELTRTPESIVKYSGVKDNGSTYGEIDNVTNPTFPFTLKEGETVIFDLGQNIAGWEQLNITGEKNTVVDIHFGEMLNDSGDASRKNDGPKGSVYNANYLEAKASGQYIMNGDPDGETYNPRFTFYGFRYIEITATRDVVINDVKGIVVGNANEENSSFETSDTSVNQLYSNIIWGQRCNFLSTATDCPQRNERLGWTADTHIFSRTAMYNSDAVGFYRKWLRDMRDSQFGPESGLHEGAYPDVAPNTHIVGGGNGGWAEAGIIVPYYLYLMYGDVQLIKEHFESMEKFMDFLERYSAANQEGEWKYGGGGAASGDWVSPELNDAGVKRYISVTYYAYSAMLMAEMSQAIGKTQAAEKYQTLYDNIKAEFAKRYVNDDGTLKVASQTTYLLALKLDLYPTKELADKGLQILLKKIENNGNRLSTGFIGTSILAQTLSDVGATDMAYTLLLSHDYPSWLYSVDQGATTIWENWDSYTLENGFKDPGMNSFNHYAYGAVGEFMYRYMAGIEADEKDPGFKHFILQPTLDGANRISYVKASYDSVYGEIKSAWEIDDDGRITYEAKVPANTTATLYLPVEEADDVILVDNEVIADCADVEYKGIEDGKAVIELGSGSYTFKVQSKDAPIPEVIIPGDVDNNKVVNVSDIMTLKGLIMTGKWDEKQLKAGDIDKNNTLNVSDMLAIKNIIMAS